ncbi:MAG: twin-arginine translocation signal domain-containing protein [Chthoniobacterales bacterium]
MKQSEFENLSSRRSFLKKSAFATGAAVLGAGLLGVNKVAFGQDSGGSLTKGDVAILRFLAAAELIESDLWTQYAELGGLTPGQVPPEVNPNQPLNPYQAALSNLDGDAQQYISSNTLDEISHATFLNAYLESKGADAVNLDQFRTLPGSQATPVSGSGGPFLTNLMHLNVDTSWYLRYRSATNPDFGATFPQAITITNRTAIPRTNADFANAKLIQVIANTAAFHFGYIEQGGSSLYAALSQKVSSLEVLKITLGIGGDEIAHFLEWVDFAGNGVQPPIAPISAEGLTFPNFFVTPGTPLFQPNLIFPIPCEFIAADLPQCAVIRPSSDKFGGARATIASFTADGLFVGQSTQFFDVVNQLAEEADAATRQV